MTWCDMMWQKVQAWRWWPWSGRRPWIHRFQFIGFLNAFNHSSKPWEKLGKHITWIKYCSNYSMCLLPGEGLLYCFFPSFFHLTVLIVSLVCEFHNHRLDQWQQKLLSTRTAGSWPVMACHGLSWPAQIFFGVVLDVLVLITATYVQAASLVQPRRATSIHGSCHFKSSCRRLSWATLIAG